MVDSRAKGARGEYLIRDMLRETTGHKFERVPASGALEYLKGDLYVPHAKNRFCIEVKNYAESPLNDSIFTAQKTNNLIRWWKKVVAQAKGGNQEPLLFFKYNRSKPFVVTVASKRPIVLEDVASEALEAKPTIILVPSALVT
mgnify:CR=1 FL=1